LPYGQKFTTRKFACFRSRAAKRRGENRVPKIRKFNSAPHSGQNPNLF